MMCKNCQNGQNFKGVLNDRFIPVSFCVRTLKFDKILPVLVVQYR
jgi:hypothetical protein